MTAAQGAGSRLAVLALAAAAAGLWCVPATRDLAPLDAEAARRTAEVTRQFGMERPVVWIVVPRGGSVWTSEALGRVQALTRGVFALPGVLAPDVVSIASPNLRDVQVSDAGFSPRYLMGEVPRAPAAVAALRARVEQDPLLRGSLVSGDGRAALVVANFRPEADGTALATAALALRDRHRDGDTDVWVVGEPVLAATAPASLRAVAPWAAAALALGVVVALAVTGARRTGAALLAGLVTGAVGFAMASVLGASLPWVGQAAVASAAVAAGLAGTMAPRTHRTTVAAGLVLGAALLVAAGASGPPLRPYLAALAAGIAMAPWTSGWARIALAAAAAPERPRWPRHVVALAILVAAAGATRLELRLEPFGYGLRYLPAPASADLAALVRHFPPPVSFAVRVRGDAGFVAAPGVLEAFDAITDAVRADPAVSSATSLADLVKRVHRAFNDDRPDFERLPDEPGMAGRYLALAYSPGFRRFIDRPLATSAIWVMVATPSLTAVTRAHAALEAAVAAHPVPGAAVDPPAGDGVALLRAGKVAAGLVQAMFGVIALAGVLFVPVVGARRAGRGVIAAASALVVAAGLVGWLGLAVDLVTLPLLAAVSLAALLVATTGGAPAT